MARMIPASLPNFPKPTAGERKVFSILKKILPDDCVARYEMLLGESDHRPDFVIIDPSRGVVIIEVKDWGVANITKAAQEQFYVKGYQGSSLPRLQINPNLKCQIYQKDAQEHLIALSSLRDDKLHLKVPVNYLIAFPNITQEEFIQNKLDTVMPIENVLLMGDLEDKGGQFFKRYNHLSPMLLNNLTPEQLSDITVALVPDIVIPTVSPSSFIDAQEQKVNPDQEVIKSFSLSLDQEDIAKSIGEGPRLLRGIAGTGKTLILLYRAKLSAANQENIRILILCWNTALANYMRQAYSQFQLEAKGRVEIMHFTDFAHNFLGFRGDPVEGWDNPAFMMRFDDKKVKAEDLYDAVYIDEAQDFRQEWIEYIFNNLIKGEPKERNLIIAADDAQRVYKQRDFSWNNLLGIPMTGRSKILRTIYRNSARVWIFSAFLLEDKASYKAEAQDKLRFAEKGGYDPQLIECKNMAAQIDKAIEIIKKLIKKGKAARNVLILYRHKILPGSQYPLVDELKRKLTEAQILHNWFAEDGGTKRSFDWSEDTVKISTVHSGKGMDSPVVIVLGAETFSPSYANDEYDETRLMYVALTRAREFLVVLYSGDRGLVPQLLHCQEEYSKRRDAIIQLESARE